MAIDPTSKGSIATDFKIASLIGMGTSNSAGEKVDLLNPMDDARAEESSDDALGESGYDAFLPDPTRRKKLAMSGEIDQTRQARQDDIAVQEQVLGLISNIICGTGASEIVDVLLNEIGRDELLSILADKLRPRPGPTRRDTATAQTSSTSTSTFQPPMPAEILMSVTYVLVNLAAGPPKHRDLLFSHRDLLKNLMFLFDHPNRIVRVNCVWVVINLTYEDDQSDRQASYERASKLKALGVVERLRNVEDDTDLDVRERTKTALHQIRKYMNIA
jgi:armadillo repeat-containing protein 8